MTADPPPGTAAPARVTCVITTLNAGGAQRVMATLANAWAGQGRSVTLVTLHPTQSDLFALDPAIRRTRLDIPTRATGTVSALGEVARVAAQVRRAIRESRPDVVLSFLTNTNIVVLLATRRLGVPVVVSERTDPRFCPVNGRWSLLRRLTYGMADALVVQSDEIAGWARQIVQPARVHVVPNPVVAPERGAPKPGSPAGECRIVGMGRLHMEKGFDRLLDAFALHRSHGGQSSLTLYGDGEERGALTDQARRLGVASLVAMPGEVSTPHAALRDADLFVLPSRYEGFPNALCEAMACGVAAVSFDCPSGPRQIVRNGIDGVLVPAGDVGALTAAIDRLASDPAERSRLGQRAAEVTERFGLEKVVARWDDLLAALRSDRTRAPAVVEG